MFINIYYCVLRRVVGTPKCKQARFSGCGVFSVLHAVVKGRSNQPLDVDVFEFSDILWHFREYALSMPIHIICE